MADDDTPSNGDPAEVGHSGQINFLADVDEIDRELEKARRRSNFLRNERWESARQYLVLACLSAITLVLLAAFAWSVWVLLPSDPRERTELARWVLETEIGGLVAGLIGLWAVKSFEK